MRIVFTGGGTGGHIFPIIAIVRELKKIRPDFRFYFIGPKDKLGSLLLSQEGIKVKHILAGKIRRYWGFRAFFQNLFDIFKIAIGFLQSFFYLFFLFPDLVFSKGGYGAFATSLLSRIFLIPVILHESDASPGLVNKLISKFALEVFVSFPLESTEYFPPRKIISVGNPIRKKITEGAKEEAKKLFELKEGKPIILILGGSQGSQRINNLIINILPQLLNNFQVLHQTGAKNFNQTKAEAGVMVQKPLINYYHPYPFLNETEIKHALKIADLIVSRAGSGSIFEITACGKPSILIPLPESAQNHQIKNAYACQKAGACVVIEEKNLTSHFFFEKLKYFFSRPEQLKKMAISAENFSRPKAAEIIAGYIVEYLLY